MSKTPKKGDKVTWETASGETRGTVEKVLTSTARVKGHVAKATEEEPQVLVKSSASGTTAIHKPDTLKPA